MDFIFGIRQLFCGFKEPYGVLAEVTHVPGFKNQLADELSRWQSGAPPLPLTSRFQPPVRRLLAGGVNRLQLASPCGLAKCFAEKNVSESYGMPMRFPKAFLAFPRYLRVVKTIWVFWPFPAFFPLQFSVRVGEKVSGYAYSDSYLRGICCLGTPCVFCTPFPSDGDKKGSALYLGALGFILFEIIPSPVLFGADEYQVNVTDRELQTVCVFETRLFGAAGPEGTCFSL